jgi:hypothetical protein
MMYDNFKMTYAQHDRGLFHFRRAAFSSTLKAKVGSTLTKVAALRITLNMSVTSCIEVGKGQRVMSS